MKNIVKLIGKFNVATLALIVFVYIVCLVLILTAVNPKHSYYIEPDYDHNTRYSELSNSYQIVYKRVNNNQKIEESYAIRTVINSRTSEDDKSDQQLSIIKYTSELKQTNGNEHYLSEISNASTTWARTSSVGEGHEPTAYFGKVFYINQSNEHKTMTFKEEMFEKPNNLKDYTNGNLIKFDDVEFRYYVVVGTDDNDYLVTMRMSTTTQKFFHIDMQSWILTNSGELLPFIGMYGYNNSTWSVANERVINNLDAKGIVCKLICYFNNQEFELHYKADFSEMTDLFANVVDVEATNCNAIQTKLINKFIAFGAVGLTVACVATVIIIGAVKAKKNKKAENAIETTATK